MKLDEKQEKLLEFVKEQHGDQKRKYTGEPYWTHLLSVAEIVADIDPDGIEIALCHDLFEDTKCNFSVLHKKLVEIGYEGIEAYKICTHVTELTDVYTKETYPYHNRVKRKKMETIRLHKIRPLSQTVKYADLIDNTSSIVKYDERFAKVYLKENEEILKGMADGDGFLYYDACVICQKALKQLNNEQPS